MPYEVLQSDDDQHVHSDEDSLIIALLQRPGVTVATIQQELEDANPAPGTLSESVLLLIQAGVPPSEISSELLQPSEPEDRGPLEVDATQGATAMTEGDSQESPSASGSSDRSQSGDPATRNMFIRRSRHYQPVARDDVDASGGQGHVEWRRHVHEAEDGSECSTLESLDSEADPAASQPMPATPPDRKLIYLIMCLVLLAILLGLLVAASIDFLPPLHYAVVYNWLTRSYSPVAFTQSGMYWRGPFNALRLVPSTIQTLAFGEQSTVGLELLHVRASNGLPMVLEVSIMWQYEASSIPALLAHVESNPPTVQAPRTYMPAVKLVRTLAISAMANAATQHNPHDFFSKKRTISLEFVRVLRAAFAPYVSFVSMQLHRVTVPPDFEAAMLTSVITRLSILEAERYKEVRAVMLRTRELAARLSVVQTVIHAQGEASRARQRGIMHAAQMAATVSKEVEAFRNVSDTVGGVTPHQVLDYTYWQLMVGDDPEAARRKPLHDVLLARPPTATTAARTTRNAV